jgi:hypothetical protein
MPGYLLFVIGQGEGAAMMSVWLLRYPINFGWAIYGAVMGALWHAISQLGKNSN